MATQLSKSDRIRKLLHLSNAEIAKRIGCRVEYVRVIRQRTSLSGNPILTPADRRWEPYRREWKRKDYWERGGRERMAKRRAEARA